MNKTEKTAKQRGQIDVKNAFIEIYDVAKCIKHWHDTSYNEKTGECEGMIVSANRIRSLWDVIEKYEHLRNSL